MPRFVLTTFIFLAAASPACASSFSLKDGSRIEGEVLSEKSTFYRVRLADGSEEVVFKSDLEDGAETSAALAPAAPRASAPAEDPDEFVIESASADDNSGGRESSGPVPREWLKGKAGYKAAVAASPNRAIALYFSAPWCGYCKVFDKQILNTSKVKNFLGGVAKVKINGDKEAELMKKFQVSGYPTFLVVREKDGFQQRIRTGSSPDEFVEECKGAGLGA